jgi:hypothetical protein
LPEIWTGMIQRIQRTQLMDFVSVQSAGLWEQIKVRGKRITVLGEVPMSGTPKVQVGETEHKQVSCQRPLSEMELRDFKNVIHNLMQDALTVWADAWAELDGRMPSGEKDPVESHQRVEPSCGWSEYFEKMWVLRHYLDFTKKLSQQ